MSWINTEIALGELTANERIKLSFKYEGDIKVTEVIPSCGCSEARWNSDTKILEVVYTPTNVPFHLKELGHDNYESRKIITVNSEKGTDILIFTATIKD